MLQADVTYMTPSATRRGLGTAIHLEVVRPGQAKLPDVGGIDCRERTDALFTVGSAVREPVARFAVGSDDAFRVQFGGRSNAVRASHRAR